MSPLTLSERVLTPEDRSERLTVSRELCTYLFVQIDYTNICIIIIIDLYVYVLICCLINIDTLTVRSVINQKALGTTTFLVAETVE